MGGIPPRNFKLSMHDVNLISGSYTEAEFGDWKGWVEMEILLKWVSRHERIMVATVMGTGCFKAASVETNAIKWGEDRTKNGFLLKGVESSC